MNFKQSLIIFSVTSVAILALNSAAAAEVIDLSTADPRVVASVVESLIPTATPMASAQVTSAAADNATATDNELIELKRSTDRRGNVHIRYAQRHNGIPVYGHQIIKHERIKGARSARAKLFTGEYIKDLSTDVAAAKAAFNSAAALEKAKELYLSTQAQLRNQKLSYNNTNSNLIYFIDSKQRAHLAYAVNFLVDLENGGAAARPNYILDAKTGAVLQQWNGLTTAEVATGPGGNLKSGQRNYDGSQFRKLDVKVDLSSNSCVMTTDNVRTVNLNGDTSGNTVYAFPCFNSNNDAINGAYSPLNDAHYFGGVIFAMYRDWYLTAPLNTVLTMRVHYGKNYENAFWDGQAMSFGDGQTRFYPLVGLDVAGHEVSHGFTEQNSGLVYANQSGGINEAFSDMAGKAAEFYMFGSVPNWNIGEEIFKGNGALRYMDKPSRDGKSIDNAASYYDGMNVHYSSGVFNRAFYFLANSPGYDVHKAFDLMVHANQHYWKPNATFQDAAQGVLMAANDLGYDLNAVITAFANVGVSIN